MNKKLEDPMSRVLSPDDTVQTIEHECFINGKKPLLLMVCLANGTWKTFAFPTNEAGEPSTIEKVDNPILLPSPGAFKQNKTLMFDTVRGFKINPHWVEAGGGWRKIC